MEEGSRLAMLLLGIVAGAMLQLQQARLWAAAWYGLVALAGLSMLLLRRSRAGGNPGDARSAPFAASGLSACAGMTLALLGAAALSFSFAGVRASAFASNALPPALEGRSIALTGLVATLPQRSDAGLRFRFDVEQAEAGVPPQILLGWYADSGPPPALRPGERWQMTVRLKAPHGNVNPHGFDYELWLWEQGLQATGYVRAGTNDPQPHRLAETWRYPVEQLRHSVRESIYAQVPDRKLAGVIAALVVGDQAAIERSDWDVFRATGVAHLMSISGLHVTMFAWLAAALVGWLWRRSVRLCLAFPAQHAALLGGLVLAALYALFSGWGVPSQRTIWMLATVGALRMLGKQWPWPMTWLLACAVVVTIDPWAMLQAGFWLSFVAVGVLFATDTGIEVGKVRGLVREQVIVTIALTPLTLLLFGQVSLIGLVANLVAIPWVTLVVTPLAMAGIFIAALWDAAAWAVQVLGVLLQFLAHLPLATFTVAAAPLWAGVAGVAGGLLLAMPWPRAIRLLGLPLLLPVLLWQAPRAAAGEFELLAADVGQGTAVLVRTAQHALVYDTGPRYSRESDAGHRVLVPLLRSFDERVDTVVLSHRDIDHTGGAVAVLTMQPQAALLSSIGKDHELQSLRPATRCEAGQHWEWDGVRFDVVHPASQDYEHAGKPNAVSCVLRVAGARAAALLTGDIEEPQEAGLLARGAELEADVLIVPHHGSKTSSSDAFLDAVRAKFAVIQAGYRNRFGHPAAPVVERLRVHGLVLFDSPRCGAATWKSWEPAHMECLRESQPHYWQHRVP
jgi:competence protein ComEC